MTTKGTQALSRALQLLESVADYHDLESLTKVTGLTRTTAYRLLTTLVEYGYVRHIPYEGYFLGPKLLELGFKLYENLHIPSIARPHLEILSEKTQETVHLAVLENKNIVYIDKVQGSRQLQMTSTIGSNAPVQSTALGKSLVSGYPKDVWPRYFDPNLVKTENTINKLDQFIDEIQLTAERGYSLDMEENEIGIRCVAAPIFDGGKRVVGAVSISGATIYFDLESMQKNIKFVKETAENISRELGWSE